MGPGQARSSSKNYTAKKHSMCEGKHHLHATHIMRCGSGAQHTARVFHLQTPPVAAVAGLRHVAHSSVGQAGAQCAAPSPTTWAGLAAAPSPVGATVAHTQGVTPCGRASDGASKRASARAKMRAAGPSSHILHTSLFVAANGWGCGCGPSLQIFRRQQVPPA